MMASSGWGVGKRNCTSGGKFCKHFFGTRGPFFCETWSRNLRLGRNFAENSVTCWHNFNEHKQFWLMNKKLAGAKIVKSCPYQNGRIDAIHFGKLWAVWNIHPYHLAPRFWPLERVSGHRKHGLNCCNDGGIKSSGLRLHMEEIKEPLTGLNFVYLFFLVENIVFWQKILLE